MNPSVAIYLEPPSHHFFDDKLFNVDTNPYGGDQILAPYVSLKGFFEARGIPIHTADFLPAAPNGARNIYISMGMRHNYRQLAKRDDTILSAFFAMECPIVEPALYRSLPDVQRYFKRVFSWSDSPSLERFVGAPLRLEHCLWPQSFNRVHDLWNRRDRKFLVMINTNRRPALNWKELYTERLRALEFFGRSGEIDLYGRGWDGPPYRMGMGHLPGTVLRLQRFLEHQWLRIRPDPYLAAARKVWRGAVRSKSKTLGQYNFALCFENSILKGWITEKIFECFFAGTVPVYWGAPEITDYVPADCFIDMRRFNNYSELREFLKSLTDGEIQAYKERAREYISSASFKQFSKETFVDIFRRIVEQDAGLPL